MNFGAFDGIQIHRLTRIVAYHSDGRRAIRGFAFFYTDGTTKTFGSVEIIGSALKRRTCVEQSIAIDGPNGERIVDVQYTLSKNGLGSLVEGVKVSTIFLHK